LEYNQWETAFLFKWSSVFALLMSAWSSCTHSDPCTICSSIFFYVSRYRDSFSYFAVKDLSDFFMCSTLSSGTTSIFVCSINPISKLCNLIRPSDKYFSVIYFYIHLAMFNASVSNPMVFSQIYFLCLHVY
jgi:hypothetical protein